MKEKEEKEKKHYSSFDFSTIKKCKNPSSITVTQKQAAGWDYPKGNSFGP